MQHCYRRLVSLEDQVLQTFTVTYELSRLLLIIDGVGTEKLNLFR